MNKKMKKKADWITKPMKRRIKKEERGIVDLMKIVFHFFQELPQWINEMTDPRNPSYIIYRYWYETIGEDGTEEAHEFQWITNIELTDRNLEEMIEAGRGRWKILYEHSYKRLRMKGSITRKTGFMI